jgi:hypothetical protein
MHSSSGRRRRDLPFLEEARHFWCGWYQVCKGAALVVVALMTGAQGSAAQDRLVSQPLDSGALVRVHFDGDSHRRVRLLSPFAPASPHMAFCDYTRPLCPSSASPAESVSVAALRRVEIPRGTHAGRGALIGAVVGAATFYLGAGFAEYGCECDRYDTRLFVITGVLGGAVVGALIGSMVKIWAPAP